jgi:TPR repeat protein
MKIPKPVAAMLGVLAIGLFAPAAGAADADPQLQPDVLRPMAEQGSLWAQLQLADRYNRGDGVAKDKDQAADWYFKAAAQGSPEGRAMLELVCVTEFLTTPAQPIKACPQLGPLLEAAAAKGDLQAEITLAHLHEEGMFGIPKDPGQVLFWLRKAAEQGNASVQFALAERYEVGVSAPKDEVQAVYWFRKAADQGDRLAETSLAQDYEEGQGVAADEALAVAWYLKAAQQGDSDAQRKVGTAYALGKGVPRDDVQAYVWLKIALSSTTVDDESHDAEALALKSVAERLSPSVLAQARRTAAAWKPTERAP